MRKLLFGALTLACTTALSLGLLGIASVRQASSHDHGQRPDCRTELCPPGAAAYGDPNGYLSSYAPCESRSRCETEADHGCQVATGSSACRGQRASQDAVSSEPQLLIFGASWCAPCQRLHESLKHPAVRGLLNSRFATIREIDVDRQSDLARKFDISAIPTLLVVSSAGEVVCQINPTAPETMLARVLDHAYAPRPHSECRPVHHSAVHDSRIGAACHDHSHPCFATSKNSRHLSSKSTCCNAACCNATCCNATCCNATCCNGPCDPAACNNAACYETKCGPGCECPPHQAASTRHHVRHNCSAGSCCSATCGTPCAKGHATACPTRCACGEGCRCAASAGGPPARGFAVHSHRSAGCACDSSAVCAPGGACPMKVALRACCDAGCPFAAAWRDGGRHRPGFVAHGCDVAPTCAPTCDSNCPQAINHGPFPAWGAVRCPVMTFAAGRCCPLAGWPATPHSLHGFYAPQCLPFPATSYAVPHQLLPRTTPGCEAESTSSPVPFDPYATSAASVSPLSPAPGSPLGRQVSLELASGVTHHGLLVEKNPEWFVLKMAGGTIWVRAERVESVFVADDDHGDVAGLVPAEGCGRGCLPSTCGQDCPASQCGTGCPAASQKCSDVVAPLADPMNAAEAVRDPYFEAYRSIDPVRYEYTPEPGFEVLPPASYLPPPPPIGPEPYPLGMIPRHALPGPVLPNPLPSHEAPNPSRPEPSSPTFPR